MAKYQGGCHCGAVRFKVDADIEKSITCSCSMCSKRGSILAFVSTAQFQLEKGEEKLTTYLFNKKIIKHQFCKVCGILAFARGTMPKTGEPMVAVNVRSLDDVDISKLQPHHIDGKKF